MALNAWILYSLSALLLLCALLLCALMLYRNNLVYQARRRRIDEIYEAQMRILFVEGPGAARPNYDEMGSYDRQMWDFRKWSYKQFYPEAP